MSIVKRLVLIDGTALVYRAFYAIPGNLHTASGVPTNAVYGFAIMFKKLFAGRKPDFGAVIFDAPGRTFRDEQFAEYKAQREAMPSPLAAQLPWIDKLVEAHRFPILRVPGYEADDVIGTLTKQAVAAGMQVLIVSGDKDFCQLLSDDVRMLDAMRDITYDPELVRKKWGVRPEHFVDLLALMGDTSDNIPGVPGIGQKSAAALLERFGSLAAALDGAGEVKGKQGVLLQTHREQALLSQSLARIDVQVPLALSATELVLPEPDEAALAALYTELEFLSLLTERQGPTASTGTALDEGALAQWLAAAAQVSLVAFDDGAPRPQWRGVGLSDGTRTVSLAFESLPAALRIFLESSREKHVHDVKRLWLLCLRDAVKLRAVTFDTMLAGFLVDSQRTVPQKLAQLAREYLQRTLPEGADSGAMCAAAEAVHALVPLLTEKIGAMHALLVTLEQPLAEVLALMQHVGIAVDAADIRRMGADFSERLAAVEKEIYVLAGHEFNVGSPKQLGAVLFDELKLPVIKRTKTGYGTDSEVLERLAPKHPIAAHLIEQRKLSKLISTYTNVLAAAVDPETGRIHATMQQTASVTGRLIATDPDLQRTPTRTAEGRRIRQAFVAPKGSVLLSADWNQIELRLLAHLSQDERLLASFRANEDVHRRTASELFHCPPEAVTAAQRTVGKTVNFATVYGQGSTALSQILGVARSEAKAMTERFFSIYSGVAAWRDRVIAQAHETGSVTTLLGRTRVIPELFSHSSIDAQTGERIAVNTPVQGSAADLCKQAMLDISRELRAQNLHARLLLQIHDELVFEVPDAEVAATRAVVEQGMTEVASLSVPLVVSIGVGATWAEAH